MFWDMFLTNQHLCSDKVLPDEMNAETFVSFNGKNELIPRSIMVDLDSTVVDEVRVAKRHKFPSNQLLSGREDAAHNFGLGYYSIGRRYLEQCMEAISNLAECCHSLQGFMIFHSIGGGTGSGLTSLLLERLCIDYPTKIITNFSIYPTNQVATSVTEPYNSLLSMHTLCEYSDLSFVMDNRALFDICKHSLKILQPQYEHMNKLICQMTSNITTSIQYCEALNSNLCDMKNNLIPYPKLHFLLTSMSPLQSLAKKGSRDVLDVDELTHAILNSHNMLAKCKTRYGKYISCCMTYRSLNILPIQVHNSLTQLSHTKAPYRQFVDWSPSNCKICVNGKISATDGSSAYMIANHTSIVSVFSRICRQYDSLFNRGAFLHWYTNEGMEEDEFCVARENMAALEEDYIQVQAIL